MSTCKICNNETSNEIFVAREMMRGTRDEFEYLECSSCGTVQLLAPPKDMSAYYANDIYGSFRGFKVPAFKTVLRNYRNKYALLSEGSAVGWLMNKFNPLPVDYCLIKEYANKKSLILDVGCGFGAYMVDLKNIGYENVSGIDPFLEEKIVHSNGVVIEQKSFEEIDKKYDVIVSHHSFEHVEDPLLTLNSIKNSLSKDGVVLLTVPIAEELYKKYKQNCYLIQAPQHFFLMTIKSMLLLAEKVGLKVCKVVRDSGNTLDWCKYSELWKRDIAVNEASGTENVDFSQSELTKFSQFINELEAKNEGDNVTFVMSLND